MKVTSKQGIRMAIAGVAGALVIGITAWQQVPAGEGKLLHHQQDTLPAREQQTARDLNREIRQLSQASATIQRMAEKDWPAISQNIKIDLNGSAIENALVQAESALDKIDAEKLSAVIERAPDIIDFHKLADVIENAMSAVDEDFDSEELRRDLAAAKAEMTRELKSAKQVTAREIEQAIREARKEISEVNRVELKAAIKDAQNDIDKALDDLKNSEKEIRTSVTRAREEIKEAETVLKGYQEMIYRMQDEKLLSTKEDYTIDYNNGSLKVNGNELNENTAGKYKRFFNNKNIEIKKRSGKISISERN